MGEKIMTPEEERVSKLSGEMITYVREHDIRYLGTLINYAKENRPDDWYLLFRDKKFHYAMWVYMESRRRRKKKKG